MVVKDDTNPDHSPLNSADFQRLLEFGKKLLSEKDLGKFPGNVLDMAIEISGADRGCILLCKEHNREIQFKATENMQMNGKTPECDFSRDIIEQVGTSGVAVFIPNVEETSLSHPDDRAKVANLISVICQPLVQDERIYGIIYLEKVQTAGVFTPVTFNSVQEFVRFVSPAVWRLLEQKCLQKLKANLQKSVL